MNSTFTEKVQVVYSTHNIIKETGLKQSDKNQNHKINLPNTYFYSVTNLFYLKFFIYIYIGKNLLKRQI